MNDFAWPTIEQGRDAMCEKTGATWVLYSRFKSRKGSGAVLRCHKYKTLKCRAHFRLSTGKGVGGLYRVDDTKSLFVHNGHVPSGPGKRSRFRPDAKGKEEADDHEGEDDEEEKSEDESTKRSKLNEDDDDEDNARDTLVRCPDDEYEQHEANVQGLHSDELRRVYPDEWAGMKPDACLNAMYRLGRMWPDMYRRSLFRRVTPIESAELFEQVLHEHERAYFAWWSMFHAGEPESPLVYLRVHGVSSVEVERSLMRLQKRYGYLTRGIFTSSGHARHAVFTCPVNPRTSALLAINMHALRSYRMLCLESIALTSAMPMAPVLMQCWSLRPSSAAEISSRRFGMMSTLSFIATTIGLGKMAFEKNGYGIMEPGFDIYDLLPAFLNQFQETDWSLRIRLNESFHVKDADECRFSNLLAAFIFQKQTHYISNIVTRQLYEHFENPCLRLKERAPEAWRIIRCTYLARGTDDWVLLDLDARAKHEKALRHPAAYYMYRLALEDGLGILPDSMRWNMCAQIIVQNIYQPTSVFLRPVMYRDTLALQYYHQALTKLSANPVAAKLRVFSSNEAHLWPLRSLFDVLRALDFHRQRAAQPRIMFNAMKHPVDYDAVDGPLRVDEPLNYARKYVNLPLAHTVKREVLVPGDPELAFMDDTLWVWGTGLKGDLTPTMEAEMLVRDPTFYHVFE